jgi:hypothetical protein
MSAPMIRSLLDGRKTQTRRIIKPQPSKLPGFCDAVGGLPTCPYGKPGYLLWVRETWGDPEADHPRCPDGRKPQQGDRLVFKANPADDYLWGAGKPSQGEFCWRPSIHMPRWASRLTLELTGVRVERLHEISEEKAIAEGIDPVHTGTGELCGYANYQHLGEGVGYFAEDPIKSYASLWESINGPGSWDANPWLWVLSFRVHQKNVDELLERKAA